MQSPQVDVILATGGTPMVRAAYRSGNPAIGVGPGNAPAFVDASADLERRGQAHRRQSKSFDNSILCTNESVVVAEESIADKLLQALAQGRRLCRQAGRGRTTCANYLFGLGTLQHRRARQERGRDRRQGRASSVPPIHQDHPGADRPRRHRRSRCPRKSSARCSASCACRMSMRGIATRARPDPPVRRRPFRGDPQQATPPTILSYARAVKALRVVVNAPCSPGRRRLRHPSGAVLHHRHRLSSAAPRSARISGRKHLVNWTRIAYSDEASEAFGDFPALETWNNQPTLPVGREAPMTIGRLQEGAERADESCSRQLAAAR